MDAHQRNSSNDLMTRLATCCGESGLRLCQTCRTTLEELYSRHKSELVDFAVKKLRSSFAGDYQRAFASSQGALRRFPDCNAEDICHSSLLRLIGNSAKWLSKMAGENPPDFICYAEGVAKNRLKTERRVWHPSRYKKPNKDLEPLRPFWVQKYDGSEFVADMPDPSTDDEAVRPNRLVNESRTVRPVFADVLIRDAAKMLLVSFTHEPETIKMAETVYSPLSLANGTKRLLSLGEAAKKLRVNPRTLYDRRQKFVERCFAKLAVHFGCKLDRVPEATRHDVVGELVQYWGRASPTEQAMSEVNQEVAKRLARKRAIWVLGNAA